MDYETLRKIMRLIMADVLDLDYLDDKIDNWVEMDMITDEDAQWIRDEVHNIIMLAQPEK